MVQLFKLLNSAVASRVLLFFLKSPTKKAYAGKILKEMEISKKSLFDSLVKLKGEGYLEATQIGRTISYSLNRNNPVVKQLKILLTLSELVPKIKHFEGKAEAYLYGSAARGEDTESSDLDLLIISKMGKVELMHSVREMSKEKTKFVILTPIEYARLAHSDTPFYERIEKDKIRLV